MTEDHDFKKLVRERMARTGESYMTARRHLLALGASGPRRTFSLAEPGSLHAALASWSPNTAVARGSLEKQRQDSHITVTDEAVHVRYGDPALFEVVVPRGSIVRASRAPDLAPRSALGAHHTRDRWLVNAAYHGIVLLELDPPAEARLHAARALPEGTRIPWYARPFVRDSAKRVRILRLSVDDPDAFLEALDRSERAQ